jgi:hypothetical protein
MLRKKVELNDDDEIMRRCRQARENVMRRFKTLDAYCDYLQSLEEQDKGKRAGKRMVRRAAAKRTAAPTAARRAVAHGP